MSYRVVLFDLDGTLINTNQLILNSFLHAFASHNLEEYTEADVLPYMGEPLLSQMRRIDEAQAEEMVKTYHQFNITHHDEFVESFPNVAEVLAQLAEAGIRMGVVSNKRREVVKMGLDRFGFTSYMEAIVCVDDEGMKGKPEPDMILHALDQLQALPEESLMVGDSRYDLMAARSAKVDTAGVAWSLHPERLKEEHPTYFFEDMRDLLSVFHLEKENA